MTSLTAAAFDSYLPSFERMLPPLLKAYDALPAGDTLTARLAEQIDRAARLGLTAGARRPFPTSLAVYWGETRGAPGGPGSPGRRDVGTNLRRAACVARGAAQRIGGGLGGPHRGFRDVADALGRHQPVPADQRRHRAAASTTRNPAFRSRSRRRCGARWPRSARDPTPTRRSGTARAATASSRSSSSATACGPRRSPPAGRAAHPARRTSTTRRHATPRANLRDVYFYRSQLTGHTEREYHPGS